MPFDESVAERVRKALKGVRGVEERRMFGGLAFMLQGHMCCGVLKDDLVLRLAPEDFDAALHRPHARPMDFTGRPLTGFVYVASQGCRTASQLLRWIGPAIDFARSLPPKSRVNPGRRKKSIPPGRRVSKRV